MTKAVVLQVCGDAVLFWIWTYSNRVYSNNESPAFLTNLQLLPPTQSNYRYVPSFPLSCPHLLPGYCFACLTACLPLPGLAADAQHSML